MTFFKGLLAKLHPLNFDMNAFNLIFDYLAGRKKRVKINSNFSSYQDIFQDLPKESEAVVWRCSVEKVFIEISQNSQDSGTGVFL